MKTKDDSELQQTFDLNAMADANKLGRKSGEGFYKYVKGKPQKNKGARYGDVQKVQDRLVMRLLNEATACLREGIVDERELIDAGVIFGTGFAPFRGGPLQYIDSCGVDSLTTTMTALQKKFGDRFQRDAGWDNL